MGIAAVSNLKIKIKKFLHDPLILFLGIIVSSPRNHLVVAQSSKPKPEKLPVELPVLNPDLIKKSHLKQDQETSGMDLKEH